ncbi:MAG: hypothetical protein ABF384_12610, partial [Verrucomicrobiales bacterium]
MNFCKVFQIRLALTDEIVSNVSGDCFCSLFPGRLRGKTDGLFCDQDLIFGGVPRKRFDTVPIAVAGCEIH